MENQKITNMDKFIFKIFCTFTVFLSKILILMKNNPTKILTFFTIILMVMSTYLLDIILRSLSLSIIFIIGFFMSHDSYHNLNKPYGDKENSKNFLSFGLFSSGLSGICLFIIVIFQLINL